MIPEEIEEIGRAAIICKMLDGDDLDRQDLQIMLRLLCKDMHHSQFAKDIAHQASLPARVKGYKLKGQGHKTGSQKTGLYAQIAIDYQQLSEEFDPSTALCMLEKESTERYGRHYTYKSILGYVTKGRKILDWEEMQFLGVPNTPIFAPQ